MTSRSRRRRAALLLSLALACGGLAASEVASHVREVDARVGTPMPVLVTAREVGPDAQLRRRDLRVRQVPEHFAPPDALTAPEEAIGSEPIAPLTKGSYVTAASLGGGTEKGEPGALRRGQRAVEVGVSGGDGLARAVGPGARVDVLVSTELHDGAGRTFVAVEDVELLDLHDGSGEAVAASGQADGDTPAATIATLRVSLRQAVYLTAAQNFAREVRLLPRPTGDRRRSGRAAVGADSL